MIGDPLAADIVLRLPHKFASIAPSPPPRGGLNPGPPLFRTSKGNEHIMIRPPRLLIAPRAPTQVSCGGSARASTGALEAHTLDFEINRSVINVTGSRLKFGVHNAGPTIHKLIVLDSSSNGGASARPLKLLSLEATRVEGVSGCGDQAG